MGLFDEVTSTRTPIWCSLWRLRVGESVHRPTKFPPVAWQQTAKMTEPIGPFSIF